MVAPLSFTSQFGYYGLRVNPTFEQVAGTVRKPLRIPLPDRRATWYALSPYRALILDAAAKFNDYEHAKLDYRQSGAALPESAAQVRPSDAGQDPMFDELDAQHHAHVARQAYDAANQIQHEAERVATAAARSEYLHAAYGANEMHPVIAAEHDELEEAGVPHVMPGPRIPPLLRNYRKGPPQYASAGQPQAPEFPAFEVLNMGQPETLRQGNLSHSQNLTYEQARDFVVQPTFST
jgi:hypothetical protein